MSKVDEEDKAEEYEDCCTNERDIVTPEHEKSVGNKEGYDNEDYPQEDFRTPPAVTVRSIFVKAMMRTNSSPILNGSALVSSVPNTKKSETQQAMEECQRE